MLTLHLLPPETCYDDSIAQRGSWNKFARLRLNFVTNIAAGQRIGDGYPITTGASTISVSMWKAAMPRLLITTGLRSVPTVNGVVTLYTT